jgi:hypothetical protein
MKNTQHQKELFYERIYSLLIEKTRLAKELEKRTSKTGEVGTIATPGRVTGGQGRGRITTNPRMNVTQIKRALKSQKSDPLAKKEPNTNTSKALTTVNQPLKPQVLGKEVAPTSRQITAPEEKPKRTIDVKATTKMSPEDEAEMMVGASKKRAKVPAKPRQRTPVETQLDKKIGTTPDRKPAPEEKPKAVDPGRLKKLKKLLPRWRAIQMSITKHSRQHARGKI